MLISNLFFTLLARSWNVIDTVSPMVSYSDTMGETVFSSGGLCPFDVCINLGGGAFLLEKDILSMFSL